MVMATVKNVFNYVKLSDEEITKVLQENQPKLNLTEKQQQRWHKKLMFSWIWKCQEIEALAFDHQGNMDDWLIIDKIEDVVVGTSIPYNYEKSRF